jgi:hypothetical protein
MSGRSFVLPPVGSEFANTNIEVYCYGPTGTNQLWGRNLLMGHREPIDLSVIRSRTGPYTPGTPSIQGKEKRDHAQ